MGLAGYVLWANAAPCAQTAASTQPHTAARCSIMTPRISIQLPAEHVRRPPCIRAAVQHPAFVIGDDRAHRTGEPGGFRPVVNLVTARGELVARRALDVRLDIESCGEI